MKKIILGLWFLLAVTAAGAQADGTKTVKIPADLSGTWILDEAKSNTGSGKDKITEYTLMISTNGPEIKMSKKFKQGGQVIVDEVVYYTDGRPEYSSRTNRSDSAAVTRWQGRKLVRRTSSSPQVDGAGNRSGLSLSFVTTDEWELSKDSNTLTRTILTTAGTMYSSSYKYVFNRKS